MTGSEFVAFVVAAGLGAAVRHGVNVRGQGWRGTLTVNVVGALLLGVLLGSDPDSGVVTVVGVGFLGSFTTFSTLALEAAEAPWPRRLAVVGTTLTLGLAAAAAGYAIA